jgi:DNA-binding CsgD family transcriptional regulator
MSTTLQISHHTVRKHRSNILVKLDLHSTAQLVAYAANLRRVPYAQLFSAEVFVGLRPREQQVALLIAKGLTGKQIARELGISPGTIRKHRDNIARRTGLRSVTDFIARAAGSFAE